MFTNLTTQVSLHEAKLLLSSLSIAAHNTGCMVPVLTQASAVTRHIDTTHIPLQVFEASQGLYLGNSFASNICTRFDSVAYAAVPSAFSHLSGLLQLFKSKLPCA